MVPRRRKTCKPSPDRLNDLPIRYRPGNGRTVIACGVSDEPDERGGYIRTAHKTVDRRYHFQHNRNAIGWAVAVVDKLRKLGVQRLRVKDSYTGVIYTCSMKTLLDHASEERLDADAQLFLSLRYWSIKHPVIEAEPAPVVPQLDLFGEVKS